MVQNNHEPSKGGKAKGRHFERRLTRATVKKAGPGRHTDGGGLYLVVDKSGAKRWLMRIVVRGNRRDFGLGSASLVDVDEARRSMSLSARVVKEPLPDILVVTVLPGMHG